MKMLVPIRRPYERTLAPVNLGACAARHARTQPAAPTSPRAAPRPRVPPTSQPAPSAPTRDEISNRHLPHGEELSEAHHERHVAAHLVLAVHEGVAAAL